LTVEQEHSGLSKRWELPGVAADFDVVGMKEIYFFALIGVEHRSLAVEMVYSELEIAGRFGSGTFFAEKQVVAAGLSQLGRCSISPTSPLVALKLLGNRESENI